MLEIKHAKYKDMDVIMDIINDAQEFLKKMAVNQWQEDYPNRMVIMQDILMNEAYLVYKDLEACAYFMLSHHPEITYQKVIEGAWTSNLDYAVIHRLAISQKFRSQGLAHQILKWIEKNLKNDLRQIRIDTHQDNQAMKALLIKNHYHMVGKIRLEDGELRDVYEKIL